MSAVSVRSPLPGASTDAGAAIRIAIVMLAVASLVGLTVGLVAAEAFRTWLGFTFPRADTAAGEVLAILADNLRLLAAILVACVVAQLAREVSPGTRAERATRAVVALCDAALIAVAAVHVFLVGAGVGAYGGRMIVALLPHGPVELAAYSLALALYVGSRRERLSARRWAVSGLGSALCLTLAAPLEVFATA
jgi:hypothetical protein